MKARVLTINCGSSSLKYAVFDVDEGGEKELVRGNVNRIGDVVSDHAAAVCAALDDVAGHGLAPCDVVGHRVVYGGPRRSTHVAIDAAVLAELAELVRFAPLHLPAEIRAIEALRQRWPDCPQIACFDTVYHRTLSEVAQRYPIPQALHEAGIRRYGFHGLSYEYVVTAVGASQLGRAVIAHLGSGASMAAVADGRAVDTTMGFTPTAGLVMGTRTGDLDPGVLVYLAEQGYDARALGDLVNRQAGLLGVSGTTGDVRELLARREDDLRARLALDVFAWSARKWIGAMTATLGGLDTLVFCGGIGENAAPVRRQIASGLEHLGVHVDEERNAHAAHDAIISPDGQACVVRVVHTDEERMVARHAWRLATRFAPAG
ncbi:MAG TPA: acetate/propionate family kinase [Polyangiaceae bacterium]|nr:acetate/propionate family kinase [Polyangiaceae bacterium]